MHQIATIHFVIGRRVVQMRDSGTHIDLDLLCSGNTDVEVVLATHELLDVSVEPVASHLHGLFGGDGAQCDDSHLTGTTTDVNNHVTVGIQHIYTATNSSSHRLVNQANFFGTSLFRRFTDSTLLHLSDTGRNTNHHLHRWSNQRVLGVGHLDELSQHQLSRLEVGNHTVPQRTYRIYLSGGFSLHHQGLLTNRHH